MDAFWQSIVDAVAQLPDDKPVWDGIRDAIVTALKNSPDSAQSKRLSRVLHESPDLRARHLDKQDRWRTVLTDGLVRRLRGPRARYRADLLAGVALAAFDSAIREWHHRRTSLVVLARQALEEARPVTAEPG